MPIEVEIDVDLLKSEMKKTYASVSEQPEAEFIFPIGRAWAEDRDYPEELAKVPEAAVEAFAGVANPWTLGRLVTGIDMTPAMLANARAAAAEMGATNVEFIDKPTG
jgi:arsenite methyltransferase